MARLRWQCRRGMLELDELFLAFLEREYRALPPEQQDAFRQLLEQGDTELFRWLFQEPEAAPAGHASIIARIRRASRPFTAA